MHGNGRLVRFCNIRQLHSQVFLRAAKAVCLAAESIKCISPVANRSRSSACTPAAPPCRRNLHATPGDEKVSGIGHQPKTTRKTGSRRTTVTAMAPVHIVSLRHLLRSADYFHLGGILWPAMARTKVLFRNKTALSSNWCTVNSLLRSDLNIGLVGSSCPNANCSSVVEKHRWLHRQLPPDAHLPGSSH